MLRYLKAMLIFAKFQAWVDAKDWGAEDANHLTQFFNTPTGAKLRVMLLNMNLRQQAISLSKSSGLEYEAGYCNGQRGTLSVLDSLSNPKQFTSEEVGPDPDSN